MIINLFIKTFLLLLKHPFMMVIKVCPLAIVVYLILLSSDSQQSLAIHVVLVVSSLCCRSQCVL